MEALKEVDALVAADPENVGAHFERGRLLTDLARPEEARAAYFEVIKRAPAHFGALNNLGGLLYSTGFRSAARSAYAEAVARNPDNPLGHFNLGNLLREEGELDGARAEYEAALRLAPDHAEAHRGMALILLENGEEAAAAEHQRASPCCLTEDSRSRFRCCCWLQPQKAMRLFNTCWMTRSFSSPSLSRISSTSRRRYRRIG
jgi:tetratricopeptide (TPR) repeat protein